MNDDALRRRMLDAALGPPDPRRDAELERELSDRPELLDEFHRLRDGWRALGALPDPEPPPDARERARAAVEARLETRAAPSRPSGPGLTWTMAAAAALLLFLGGVATGGWLLPGSEPVSRAAPTPGSPGGGVGEGARYVLLIRGDVPEEEPDAGVAAMTEWVGDLQASGRLVWAERLFPGSSVRVGSRRQEPLGGVFIVRARDRDAAVAIAGQGPHLGWGGSVEVVPTTPEPVP